MAAFKPTIHIQNGMRTNTKGMQDSQGGILRHSRIGRDDRIRTCDLLLPKQTPYRTRLHPERAADLLRWFSGRNLD